MFAFVALLQLAWLLVPSVVTAFPADTNGLAVADKARTHHEEVRAAISDMDTIYDIKRSFDTPSKPQPPQKRSQPLTPRQSDLLNADRNNTFLIPISPSDGPITNPVVTVPASNDEIIPIHWRKGPFSVRPIHLLPPHPLILKLTPSLFQLDGTFDLDTLELDVVLTLPGGKTIPIYCNFKKDCRFDVNLWLIKGYVEFYIRYGNQLWLHIDLKIVSKKVLEDYYILTFKKKAEAGQPAAAGNPSLTS